MLSFDIQVSDTKTKARAGIIETAHGQIRTPIFMPVGTVGAVKAVKQSELEGAINAQIILGNTYHLYLRPGTEVIQAAGGLHKFIDWHRPMLTDSGGYQVYSLSGTRTIDENGAEFRSHIDGSKHYFTPEGVMDIQRTIGADMIMAFDECTPYPCDEKYATNSMHLTHRWLDRCIDRFQDTSPKYNYEQSLLPIVQGSVYPHLRKQSAEYIAKKGLAANAIGGLSVGEPTQDMYDMTDLVTDILPADKPRYLMGVGKPENIVEGIARGIDMFDCVLPTRNARHGLIYTTEGVINIKNKKHEFSLEPIDRNSSIPESRRHSRAYLRHLIRTGEIYGMQIASQQNLGFFLWLVQEARQAILEGRFPTWRQEILPQITRRL